MSELLEKILSKDNMNAAYKRVCANKGAGGVDDVTVEELGDYIREHKKDNLLKLLRKKMGVKSSNNVSYPFFIK